MNYTKKQKAIDYIMKQLNDSVWKPGYRLPSETTLAKELGVNRVTVRDALVYLSSNDYIVKVDNCGHFVHEDYIPHNKKTVLIVNRLSDFTTREGFFSRNLIKHLEYYINKDGYNLNMFVSPYSDIEDVRQNLTPEKIKASNIVGAVINVFNEVVADVLIENNIPVVSTRSMSPYNLYGVFCDYFLLASAIKDLLDRYNISKYLMFSFYPEIEYERRNPNYLIAKGSIYYITDNNTSKNIFVPLPERVDVALAQKIFKEAVANIDYVPEALVFEDDLLFDIISPAFKEIDPEIMKNIKLITQANDEREFNVDLEVCRVEFNIKEVAQKAWELLYKLINNERVFIPNISIKPKVINEEILKK